jgi:hypothetical protein
LALRNLTSRGICTLLADWSAQIIGAICQSGGGTGMRQSAGAWFGAGLALTLSMSIAHGQAIQKCVDAAGKVVYQDKPCDAGKTVAGEVQRDLSRADPAAIRRAQEERERSEKFTAARARQQAADDERQARADDAEAKRLVKAEADARARADAEPRYYYVPIPVVQQPAGRSAGASPAITQPPGILDTPAPCTTLQCRKKK